MKIRQVTTAGGSVEQALVLTQFGRELLQGVMNTQWPGWRRRSSPVPTARQSGSIDAYFTNVIGRALSERAARAQEAAVTRTLRKQTEGVLDYYDVQALKVLAPAAFEEGRRRLITHVRIENVRSGSLVRLAKARFKQQKGHLTCEVCGFDFEAVYRDRGEDYIEAHHRKPISQLDEVTEVTIDDLAMVCSNCHRMLHRRPWTTVEQLRKVVSPHP